MKTLHCVLKKPWFEKIKSGEKTHEYREDKDYWFKRIYSINDLNELDFKVDKVCFSLGMSKEPDKRMLFKIRNITTVYGGNTDLHCEGLVYDIELGERLE